MRRDVLRVLGLWRGHAGWLVAGVAMAVLSALAGVALLVLAARVISGAVAQGRADAVAVAGFGVAALLWLRPVMLFRPVARYLERLVTHEATFRALAMMRVWFFTRLAERLPAGLGLRRAGDLLGRLVADVEALDGLYLRVIVPGAAALAVVLTIALAVGAAEPGLAAILALPLAAALALPVLLAPAAARAGTKVAEAQGALRSAVVEPLTGFEDTLAANGEAAAAARRLFEAADTREAVPDPVAPAALPPGHALRLSGVTFAWAPDRPAVFDGLDLDVPEGTRVALLGPSGTGKSSLAALLLKFAAPQQGLITLGGVDIATLAAADLRRRVAWLTQDARLFDDSIAANLRLAAPDATEAELWRALDRAQIGDLVRSLPDGLETMCGEAGARFSGGQGRRLALARTLLSPAPVLILDEPAAGLDADTERAFLATLDEATAGRTVILILHRLTGVERPNRILRLVGGRAIPATG